MPQLTFERVEKKYLLTPAQLDALAPLLHRHMQMDQYGRHTICNVYYDTPDYRLIRTSLQKPVYKEKLRLTLDENIRWRTDALALSAGDRGSPLSVQGLYLMEVKLPGVMPLWLAHGLAQAGAAPVSFSKYGCCYREFLQEDVRHAG